MRTATEAFPTQLQPSTQLPLQRGGGVGRGAAPGMSSGPAAGSRVAPQAGPGPLAPLFLGVQERAEGGSDLCAVRLASAASPTWELAALDPQGGGARRALAVRRELITPWRRRAALLRWTLTDGPALTLLIRVRLPVDGAGAAELPEALAGTGRRAQRCGLVQHGGGVTLRLAPSLPPLRIVGDAALEFRPELRWEGPDEVSLGEVVARLEPGAPFTLELAHAADAERAPSRAFEREVLRRADLSLTRALDPTDRARRWFAQVAAGERGASAADVARSAPGRDEIYSHAARFVARLAGAEAHAHLSAVDDLPLELLALGADACGALAAPEATPDPRDAFAWARARRAAQRAFCARLAGATAGPVRAPRRARLLAAALPHSPLPAGERRAVVSEVASALERGEVFAPEEVTWFAAAALRVAPATRARLRSLAGWLQPAEEALR
ncbi:MAG: hypothetical protein R3F49_20105 [Planctomycetota bacterium]